MTEYQQQPWPESPSGYLPPPGYGSQQWQPGSQPQRKRRHVFRWIFIAIQLIFIILIIVELVGGTGQPSSAVQAAHQCAGAGWQGLFKSQHDCDVHYAVALNDAGHVGRGIGVALLIILWCVIDFLVGVPYAIWRLASRGGHRR